VTLHTAQGSRGPGGVPGFSTRRVDHWHGIRHRRRHRAARRSNRTNERKVS